MAIVSFKHNFIFIKTTKTAGTSIEVDLNAHLGPTDIATKIIPAHPRHTPQNHLTAAGTPLFFNHMTAAEIRTHIGAKRFESMFKFCVERDPIEKCISHFHMRLNSPLHNNNGQYQHSWDAYVSTGRFPVDAGKYSMSHKGDTVCIVDKILRYDDLQRQLSDLMKTLGLNDFALKARLKSEYSQHVLIRKEDVTPAQRQSITEAFQGSADLHRIDWATPPD